MTQAVLGDTSILPRLEKAYDAVNLVTRLKIPYVYGGGHNPQFTPSGPINDPTQEPYGLDCSGFASLILHDAGILAIPHAVWPLDTAEFETWGLPGEGRYLTLWVRNDSVEQHCALDFHGRPEWTQRWAQAAHEGTLVGWLDFSPVSFAPRHWPNT